MSVGPEGFWLFGELQELISESSKDERIVLVAGASAELYTQGQTTTGDLDIVVPVAKRAKVEEALRELGFKPKSEDVRRLWEGTYEGKELVVDIVDSDYEGGRVWNNIDLSKFGFGPGKIDSVSSPEDLLVLYLSECKFWGSNCDRAYILLRTFYDAFDREYLEEELRKANVEEKYLDPDFLLSAR